VSTDNLQKCALRIAVRTQGSRFPDFRGEKKFEARDLEQMLNVGCMIFGTKAGIFVLQKAELGKNIPTNNKGRPNVWRKGHLEAERFTI
jgi:hypothetical protein